MTLIKKDDEVYNLEQIVSVKNNGDGRDVNFADGSVLKISKDEYDVVSKIIPIAYNLGE